MYTYLVWNEFSFFFFTIFLTMNTSSSVSFSPSFALVAFWTCLFSLRSLCTGFLSHSSGAKMHSDLTHSLPYSLFLSLSFPLPLFFALLLSLLLSLSLYLLLSFFLPPFLPLTPLLSVQLFLLPTHKLSSPLKHSRLFYHHYIHVMIDAFLPLLVHPAGLQSSCLSFTV